MPDLVDFVSEESETCARHVIEYLRGGAGAEPQLPAEPDSRLGYVVPNTCRRGSAVRFYMRPRILCRKAKLSITAEGRTLLTKNVMYVKPAEMISVELPGEATKDLSAGAALQFTLEEVEK